MREWPSLFISHGAPTLLIEESATRRFLRQLGQELGRPSSILCVSAHWETVEPAVTASLSPATIHDFHGFPRALYEFAYPVPGEPQLARDTLALLQAAGLNGSADPARGLDHGAWVPLATMFPEADIPVVQLSVQPARDAAHHIALGRALAPLRREGVLILGSGSLTHNLGELQFPGSAGSAAPASWASEFANWVDGMITTGDLQGLEDYRRIAPASARAHPTDEHLLPLHVAARAGGGAGIRLHDAFMFGSLSMAAYVFPGLPSAQAAVSAPVAAAR